jgi:hypothetical protein
LKSAGLIARKMPEGHKISEKNMLERVEFCKKNAKKPYQNLKNML